MLTKIEQEQVRNVLTEARALVARGWCKENLWIDTATGERSYCALGAIRSVAMGLLHSNTLFHNAADQFFQHLQKSYNNNISSIINWNDLSETTQEIVLAAFDEYLAI